MKLLLAIVLSVCCLGLGSLAAEPTAYRAFPQDARPASAVNINEASVEDLQTLPRIGKTVAQRIVSFREEHGPFERIEELMNVRGVGEKTFMRLKERITVGSKGKSQNDSRGR